MIVLHIIIGMIRYLIAWLIVFGTIYGIGKLITTCIVLLVEKKGRRK